MFLPFFYLNNYNQTDYNHLNTNIIQSISFKLHLTKINLFGSTTIINILKIYEICKFILLYSLLFPFVFKLTIIFH